MYRFSDRIYLWEPNSESDRPLKGLIIGDILYLKNVDEKKFNEIKEVLFKYKVKYYIDSHYNEILNQEKIEKYLNQLQDYMNKQNS